MDICTELNNNFNIEKSIVTLGSFDGLHEAHIKLIEKTVTLSKKNNLSSVLVTYNPNPKAILNKKINYEIKVLMDYDSKINIIKKLGIDYLWIIPFDKKFSKITAKYFIKDYINTLNPVDILVGYNHFFGYKKEGDINFLFQMSNLYNYTLHKVDKIVCDNTDVNSSNIRKYLLERKINLANKLLGRNYSIRGKVIKGNGIGRNINFPTANILPIDNDQLIPSNGVYCVDVQIKEEKYLGMCNIGVRPTFCDDNIVNIEVHVITDDNISIYGKNVTIHFKEYIRQEKKYKNKEQLITQLKKDKYLCLSN